MRISCASEPTAPWLPPPLLASPGILRFSPYNWSQPAVVNLTVLDDDIAGPDRALRAVTFTLVPYDSDYDAALLFGASLRVVNTTFWALENDAVGVCASAMNLSVDEGFGANYSVSLRSQVIVLFQTH